MSCNNCKIRGQYQFCNLSLDKAELLIVGEGVTANEVRKNQCLTGAGGDILKKVLLQEGFDQFSIECTTALRCNVPKVKKKYSNQALEGCKDNLIEAIMKVRPKVIMLCGSVPLQVLTGIFGTSLKVTSYYGYVKKLSDLYKNWLSYDADYDPYVVVCRNPGIVLHKPNEIKALIPEIQLVKKLLLGEDVRPFKEEIKYKVINTEQECKELYNLMHNEYSKGSFEAVGLDIEATGLDYRVVDFLVLGIYFGKDQAYVIPRHLRHMLHNFLEGVPWKCIWQNGKQKTCRL